MEILILISTLLLGLLLILAYKFSRLIKLCINGSGRWGSLGFPHIPYRFPFASIKDIVLIKKTTGELFEEYYRRFPESSGVGYFDFEGRTALLLRDPELIKIVLIKEFNNFGNNLFTITPDTDPLFGINPFVIKGIQEWKSIRNIHTSSYTPSKLKFMINDILEVCENMKQFIQSQIDNPIEMKEMAGLFTMDVVSRIGYGFAGNSFQKGGNGFGEPLYGKIFVSKLKAHLGTFGAIYAPNIGRLFKLRIFSKEIEEFFVNVVKTARIHRASNQNKRNDLLQQLLDTQDPQNPGKPAYTDIEIAGHCMTLFIDGVETSSVVLSYLFYEISIKKTVQEKLREEINNSINSLEDITYEQLQSLQYLDMVISETLRCHPPIFYLGRTCTAENGFRLAGSDGKVWPLYEGDPVVVPLMALFKDEALFPRSNEFLPERFMEDPNGVKHLCFYPFGGGPRICIGMRFALVQIKMAVIAVVKNFKMETKENSNRQIELDPYSTLLRNPAEGLWIKFTEIKK